MTAVAEHFYCSRRAIVLRVEPSKDSAHVMGESRQATSKEGFFFVFVVYNSVASWNLANVGWSLVIILSFI